MDNYIIFVISILYNESILKCALKVKRDYFKCADVIYYPMEPENKKELHALLPLHVRECGPIVDVEEIFESVIL